MTRVLKSSFIAVLIILAVTSGLFYYLKYHGLYSKVLKAIPPDAVMIFTLNQSDSIVQQMLQSAFLKNYNSFAAVQNFQNSLNLFHAFYDANNKFKQLTEDRQITVSMHITKADDFDLLFLMNTNGIDNINFVVSKLFGNVANENNRNYDGVDVHDLTLENKKLFSYAYAEGIFIASQTPLLVEDAIRQLHTGKSIEQNKSLETALNETALNPFRVYVNQSNLKNWLKIFLKQSDELPDIKMNGWTALSINNVFGYIDMQGYTVPDDSMSVLSPFKNQLPRNLWLLSMLPANTSMVKASCYGDKKVFLNQLSQVLIRNESTYLLRNKLTSNENISNVQITNTLENALGNEYAFFQTESSSSNSKSNAFAIIQLNDLKNSLTSLQQIASHVAKLPHKKSVNETYRGHKISCIDIPQILPAIFGNDFEDITEFYYTDMRNYIIVANQSSSLRAYIDEFEKSNFLEKTKPFADMKQHISLNTNYFILIQPARSYYSLKQILSDSLARILENNRMEYSRTGLIALSYKGGSKAFDTRYYANITEQVVASVNIMWNVQSESSIVYGPVLMSTADSNKFIGYQDSLLQFYLVDHSGNIVLKEQLNEKIVGKLSAIDYYKNGAFEILLNTKSKLYLFDLKGNDVTNFPLNLPSLATCGHSVFDFDNTLDYRIYVPCANGQVYGYQSSGKPILNWNFKSSSLIENPVQCFMVHNKEHIIINASNGVVQIIDRTGKKIMGANETFKLMPQSWFYADDSSDSLSLFGLNSSGELWHTDSIFSFDKIDFGEATNINYWTYEDINADNKKDFILISGNTLIALNRDKSPIFSYTFGETLGSSISIGEDAEQRKLVIVYGNETHSAYAINSNGKMQNGFPVKSFSYPLISDLNNDRMFKLITASDSVNVSCYSFQ